MKAILLVFAGGGLGSVCRYCLGKWLNSVEHPIPYGTFLANIFGSLCIGFILGYAVKNSSFSQNYTLLLATGFCGGFTTFSTFSYENYTYLKNGDYLHFSIYTLSTLVVGIVAIFLGIYLSKIAS